ncbi:TRAP transporter large permease [Testudinibacter aquarius]|uniref:TRAP transporter large permease protein n=1 Tax=Testudinibacter aquarius TaxID=1524974 RepID=A0A4R3YG18_9PAST|nr:TRAP transporter large permease subunit [Testudinibacter aquarius]KAE9527546.1 C4-dicarboxylate ABC transporter permease [Testudinibacter aquarius]TCV89473.1 tripartite ATP-independent transporter DctM subunit [Testudinibacter aquarius]TNG89373.1 TRAP transporter large permease subunit [Testudinibacter aquarius]
MFGFSEMGIELVTTLIFIVMCLLLVIGIPLAFLTGLIATLLAVGWFSPDILPMIVNRVYGFMTSYSLLAVPMFVLMASLLDKTGIAKDLYNAMWLTTRKFRTGVALQTVLIGVFLAAMSGIIGGETVLLGLLALPQMLRLGYDKNLAIGTVVASGALGTMVPPSIVLIIYGLVASVSIGDLFTASFIPAFMLAAMYILYIIIRGKLNPAMLPDIPDEERNRPISKEERKKARIDIALPAMIALLVLGSIYGGIASVTEAAAVGVIAVLLVSIYRKELNLTIVKEASYTTMQTCGMIMWIGIGAYILVGVYNLVGGNHFVESLLVGSGLPPIGIILIMMLILFVLGLFLDWIGIAMLTMPIFVPIVQNLGFDPIWFGVLFCVNMQVSFLSPPFGPAAFYLHSVAPEGIELVDIFKSVLPFILIQIILLTLLIVFPDIALFLVK